MRAVIEKAFNLPSSFSQIDIDQQRAVLMDKAKSVLGTDKLTVFQDSEVVDKVITRFLARSQIEAAPPTRPRRQPRPSRCCRAARPAPRG